MWANPGGRAYFEKLKAMFWQKVKKRGVCWIWLKVLLRRPFKVEEFEPLNVARPNNSLTLKATTTVTKILNQPIIKSPFNGVKE